MKGLKQSKVKVISLFAKFEYYKSIDEMPVYNWFKIQETNDITWGLINKRDCTTKQLLTLEFVLHRITNEYLDSFGISDRYRAILRLKGDISCLEADLLLTADRSNLTFIELKQKELGILLKSSNDSDMMSVQIHVRKYMGQKINVKETSVREFYSILREMKKEIENK